MYEQVIDFIVTLFGYDFEQAMNMYSLLELEHVDFVNAGDARQAAENIVATYEWRLVAA